MILNSYLSADDTNKQHYLHGVYSLFFLNTVTFLSRTQSTKPYRSTLLQTKNHDKTDGMISVISVCHACAKHGVNTGKTSLLLLRKKDSKQVCNFRQPRYFQK